MVKYLESRKSKFKIAHEILILHPCMHYDSISNYLPVHIVVLGKYDVFKGGRVLCRIQGVSNSLAQAILI